jgi:hypothetical protein
MQKHGPFTQAKFARTGVLHSFRPTKKSSERKKPLTRHLIIIGAFT